MKKVVIAVLVVLTMAFALSAVAENKISLEDAKKTALDYAGVKPENATFIKAHLDWDDGRLVYEIEFYANGLEYEYSIDAQTCAITEKSVEKDD